MIYNDIHALQRTSVQVRGRESPSLSPLVLSDSNPVRPVLLGSFPVTGALRTGSTCFELKILYHTISLHMNVLEAVVYSSEGPSVWIHMASCLTMPTDHVRLHPLTEFVHCGTYNAIPETLQGTLEQGGCLFTQSHADRVIAYRTSSRINNFVAVPDRN